MFVLNRTVKSTMSSSNHYFSFFFFPFEFCCNFRKTVIRSQMMLTLSVVTRLIERQFYSFMCMYILFYVMVKWDKITCKRLTYFFFIFFNFKILCSL